MRYLVLSDIHGNLEALEAVLRAVGAQQYEALLVLGDLVGYGADPNAVVERVRGLNPLVVIRGNHDRVAAGIDDAGEFNAVARSAARWTQQALTADNRDYLAALPAGPHLVDASIEICHGSPFDEDLYIFEDLDAVRALMASERPVCFFGHTHVALVVQLLERAGVQIDSPRGHPEVEVVVQAGRKYLINPGSVGQPRDGDSRAAYAIADLERRQVLLCRVSYPIQTAQGKILAAGLPPVLAHRLAMGR